jgi:hypothetical protein
VKELEDFGTQEIRRLLEQEPWGAPPMDVTRTRLTRGQQVVFWGLRVYVVVMTVVVVWAFLHGAAG